ncbi:S-layer homology domain-containing protein [Paenibacillus terrigena]|nr:S-layer homology domain-containing protein [Paenibacillus terrigena]
MLVNLQIIKGNGQGVLNPQGLATRAETATLLFNLLSEARLVHAS